MVKVNDNKCTEHEHNVRGGMCVITISYIATNEPASMVQSINTEYHLDFNNTGNVRVK